MPDPAAPSPNVATLFICSVQGPFAKRSKRSTGSAADFSKLVASLLDPLRRDDPDYDPLFDVIRRAGSKEARGFKCRPHWRLTPRGVGTREQNGDALFQGRAVHLDEGPYGAEESRYNALQLPTPFFGECGSSFSLVQSGPQWVVIPEGPAIEDKEAPPELPEGEWGWRKEDVPKGAILVYELGESYVSGNGVEFTLCEMPRQVCGKPGYWVGPVLLLSDQTVGVLVWGPKTTKRRGAIARAFRRWFMREERQ
jgi:hypothetical protein